MREIEDTYKNGQYVRRWSWVNGEPRCVENAVAADVADMPALLANNQFVRDIQAYDIASKRLSQHILADGRPEIIESQPTGGDFYNALTEQFEPLMHDVVVQAAIDPLPLTVEDTVYDAEGNATVVVIENPLITADVAERLAAQAVVDATSQAVREAA